MRRPKLGYIILFIFCIVAIALGDDPKITPSPSPTPTATPTPTPVDDPKITPTPTPTPPPTPWPTPVNNTCSTAIEIECGQTINGALTQYATDSSIGCNYSFEDVWYYLDMSNLQIGTLISASFTNGSTAGLIGLFTNTCESLNLECCNLILTAYPVSCQNYLYDGSDDTLYIQIGANYVNTQSLSITCVTPTPTPTPTSTPTPIIVSARIIEPQGYSFLTHDPEIHGASDFYWEIHDWAPEDSTYDTAEGNVVNDSLEVAYYSAPHNSMGTVTISSEAVGNDMNYFNDDTILIKDVIPPFSSEAINAAAPNEPADATGLNGYFRVAIGDDDIILSLYHVAEEPYFTCWKDDSDNVSYTPIFTSPETGTDYKIVSLCAGTPGKFYASFLKQSNELHFYQFEYDAGLDEVEWTYLFEMPYELGVNYSDISATENGTLLIALTTDDDGIDLYIKSPSQPTATSAAHFGEYEYNAYPIIARSHNKDLFQLFWVEGDTAYERVGATHTFYHNAPTSITLIGEKSVFFEPDPADLVGISHVSLTPDGSYNVSVNVGYSSFDSYMINVQDGEGVMSKELLSDASHIGSPVAWTTRGGEVFCFYSKEDTYSGITSQNIYLTQFHDHDPFDEYVGTWSSEQIYGLSGLDEYRLELASNSQYHGVIAWLQHDPEEEFEFAPVFHRLKADILVDGHPKTAFSDTVDVTFDLAENTDDGDRLIEAMLSNYNTTLSTNATVSDFHSGFSNVTFSNGSVDGYRRLSAQFEDFRGNNSLWISNWIYLDLEAPTFSGIERITPVTESTVRIEWYSAWSSDTTDVPYTYNVYMSSSSGTQDFDNPTTSVIDDLSVIMPFDLETPRYYVVRAEDAHFHEETNTNELCDIFAYPELMDSDDDGLYDWFEQRHTYPDGVTTQTLWLDYSNPDTDGDATTDDGEDFDGDGCTNLQEQTQGTNPYNPDTDGDGYMDCNDPDPLFPDTDNDGLADWFEITYSNLVESDGILTTVTLVLLYNNNDTDGDGIWDGFEDPDNDMANNLAEQSLNTNPLNSDTDDDYILDGIEDRPTTGIRDLALVSPNYTNSETDALNPDTDGDGLLDGEEDANQNGILDSGETDPLIADTDDDGIPDGEELLPSRDSFTSVVLYMHWRHDYVHWGHEYAVEGDKMLDRDHDGLSDAFEQCRGKFNLPNFEVWDSDFDGLSDGEEIGIDVIEVSVHNYGPGFTINGIEAYEITSYTLKLHQFVDLFLQAEGNPVYNVPLSNFVIPQSNGTSHGNTKFNIYIDEYEEADLYGSANIPSCNWSTLDGARLFTRINMVIEVMADGENVSNIRSIDFTATGTNPTKTDSDGDGIPDRVEVITAGLDPNNQSDGMTDFDGDGLSVSEEYLAGTSINLYDTDGDGLHDGKELGTAGYWAPADHDKDGIIDALESCVSSSNSYGVPDQFYNRFTQTIIATPVDPEDFITNLGDYLDFITLDRTSPPPSSGLSTYLSDGFASLPRLQIYLLTANGTQPYYDFAGGNANPLYVQGTEGVVEDYGFAFDLTLSHPEFSSGQSGGFDGIGIEISSSNPQGAFTLAVYGQNGQFLGSSQGGVDEVIAVSAPGPVITKAYVFPQQSFTHQDGLKIKALYVKGLDVAQPSAGSIFYLRNRAIGQSRYDAAIAPIQSIVSHNWLATLTASAAASFSPGIWSNAWPEVTNNEIWDYLDFFAERFYRYRLEGERPKVFRPTRLAVTPDGNAMVAYAKLKTIGARPFDPNDTWTNAQAIVIFRKENGRFNYQPADEDIFLVDHASHWHSKNNENIDGVDNQYTPEMHRIKLSPTGDKALIFTDSLVYGKEMPHYLLTGILSGHPQMFSLTLPKRLGIGFREFVDAEFLNEDTIYMVAGKSYFVSSRKDIYSNVNSGIPPYPSVGNVMRISGISPDDAYANERSDVKNYVAQGSLPYRNPRLYPKSVRLFSLQSQYVEPTLENNFNERRTVGNKSFPNLLRRINFIQIDPTRQYMLMGGSQVHKDSHAIDAGGSGDFLLWNYVSLFPVPETNPQRYFIDPVNWARDEHSTISGRWKYDNEQEVLYHHLQPIHGGIDLNGVLPDYFMTVDQLDNANLPVGIPVPHSGVFLPDGKSVAILSNHQEIYPITPHWIRDRLVVTVIKDFVNPPEELEPELRTASDSQTYNSFLHEREAVQWRTDRARFVLLHDKSSPFFVNHLHGLRNTQLSSMHLTATGDLLTGVSFGSGSMLYPGPLLFLFDPLSRFDIDYDEYLAEKTFTYPTSLNDVISIYDKNTNVFKFGTWMPEADKPGFSNQFVAAQPFRHSSPPRVNKVYFNNLPELVDGVQPTVTQVSLTLYTGDGIAAEALNTSSSLRLIRVDTIPTINVGDWYEVRLHAERSNPQESLIHYILPRPLPNGNYRIEASADWIVNSTDHAALDGEWGEFVNDGLNMSGDGAPGGDFWFYFQVDNHGEVTFEDYATTLGVANAGFSHGVAWGDFDLDGWPDLYVTNFSSPGSVIPGDTDNSLASKNYLYRNVRGEYFEDVTDELQVAGPETNHADLTPLWIDADNDGDLDLLIADSSAEDTLYYNTLFDSESPTSPVAAFSEPRALVYPQQVKLSGVNSYKDGLGSRGAVSMDLDRNALSDLIMANNWSFADLNSQPLIDAQELSWPFSLFYENHQPGRLEQLGSVYTLNEFRQAESVVSADIDLDGDLDFFFCNASRVDDVFEDFGGQPNSLYLNATYFDVQSAKTVFAVNDISTTSGLGEEVRFTRSAVFGDYDNDGDPDLFIINQNSLEVTVNGTICQLFENRWFDPVDPHFNLNGADKYVDLFINVTGIVGIPEAIGHSAYSADWGDYDNDGWLDLYIVTTLGRSWLFRNISDEWGLNVPRRFALMNGAGTYNGGYGQSAVWIDFDNDGDLDLYAANHSQQSLYSVSGLEWEAPNRLFLNNARELVAPASLPFDLTDGLIQPGGGPLWAPNNSDVVTSATPSISWPRDSVNSVLRLHLIGVPDDAGTTTGSSLAALGAVALVKVDLNQDGFIGRELSYDKLTDSQHLNYFTLEPRLGGFGNVDPLDGKPGEQLSRTLTAGNGSFGQGGYDLHFGLNTVSEIDELLILWPDERNEAQNRKSNRHIFHNIPMPANGLLDLVVKEDEFPRIFVADPGIDVAEFENVLYSTSEYGCITTTDKVMNFGEVGLNNYTTEYLDADSELIGSTFIIKNVAPPSFISPAWLSVTLDTGSDAFGIRVNEKQSFNRRVSFALPKGDSVIAEVRYIPQSEGYYCAQLQIETNGDSYDSNGQNPALLPDIFMIGRGVPDTDGDGLLDYSDDDDKNDPDADNDGLDDELDGGEQNGNGFRSHDRDGNGITDTLETIPGVAARTWNINFGPLTDEFDTTITLPLGYVRDIGLDEPAHWMKQYSAWVDDLTDYTDYGNLNGNVLTETWLDVTSSEPSVWSLPLPQGRYRFTLYMSYEGDPGELTDPIVQFKDYGVDEDPNPVRDLFPIEFIQESGALIPVSDTVYCTGESNEPLELHIAENCRLYYIQITPVITTAINFQPRMDGSDRNIITPAGFTVDYGDVFDVAIGRGWSEDASGDTPTTVATFINSDAYHAVNPWNLVVATGALADVYSDRYWLYNLQVGTYALELVFSDLEGEGELAHDFEFEEEPYSVSTGDSYPTTNSIMLTGIEIANEEAPYSDNLALLLPQGVGTRLSALIIYDCTIDSDNDGLSDAFENGVSHTLPNNWDSDGDGLSDGQEVKTLWPKPSDLDTSENVNHTELEETGPNGDFRIISGDFIRINPNDFDTDDDGVSDGEDGFFDADNDGLPNALDPDSDNDGVYDGTELGITEADRHTTDTNTSANWFFQGNNAHAYWDWGSDAETDRPNFIADEDPETKTSHVKIDTDGDGFRDGPTINRNLIIRYGEDANANGKDDNGPSSKGSASSPETDPNDPTDYPDDVDPAAWDSDLDGLPDTIEEEIGTIVGDADSDDDGISDGDEYYGKGPLLLVAQFWNQENAHIKTNPLNADSDYDGIPDGTEAGVYLSILGKDNLPDTDIGDSDGDLIIDVLSSGSNDGTWSGNKFVFEFYLENEKYVQYRYSFRPDADSLTYYNNEYITHPLRKDTNMDKIIDGLQDYNMQCNHNNIEEYNDLKNYNGAFDAENNESDAMTGFASIGDSAQSYEDFKTFILITPLSGLGDNITNDGETVNVLFIKGPSIENSYTLAVRPQALASFSTTSTNNPKLDIIHLISNSSESLDGHIYWQSKNLNHIQHKLNGQSIHTGKADLNGWPWEVQAISSITIVNNSVLNGSTIWSPSELGNSENEILLNRNFGVIPRIFGFKYSEVYKNTVPPFDLAEWKSVNDILSLAHIYIQPSFEIEVNSAKYTPSKYFNLPNLRGLDRRNPFHSGAVSSTGNIIRNERDTYEKILKYYDIADPSNGAMQTLTKPKRGLNFVLVKNIADIESEYANYVAAATTGTGIKGSNLPFDYSFGTFIFVSDVAFNSSFFEHDTIITKKYHELSSRYKFNRPSTIVDYQLAACVFAHEICHSFSYLASEPFYSQGEEDKHHSGDIFNLMWPEVLPASILMENQYTITTYEARVMNSILRSEIANKNYD